jgi:Protein of unknown function (DUF3300)
MIMKTQGAWKYAVIVLATICLALPATIFAQEEPAKQAATAKVFKQEELDQLVAPIALYPDNVLTQIFIASTYPLEVVEAERWVKKNKNLKGDALESALTKQPWDNSVKSLAPFPDVLSMMSEKLDWTQKLGDAFLAQQKDVMNTVQQLRRKALEAGNLKSTKEQEMKRDGDIIIIQPVSPQIVYVPTYNTTVVYGPWPYPAYPPYPVYVYPPGAAIFTFSMGVAVGSAWHGGNYHNDWHGGNININNSTNINVNRPGTGGAKPEQWKHNPEHRQGVAYRDTSTRDKYSPTNRAAVDSRKDYRGNDKSGTGVADRNAGKQSARVQDNKSGRSGSGAKTRDSAFGGMDRGRQVQKDSARGNKSMTSPSFQDSASSRSGGASRGGVRGRK